jgi:catecholate siderophore receptor
VLDPSLAAVAGAQITVIGREGLFRSSTVSDRNGEFSLALNSGEYEVQIVAKGFLEVSQPIRFKAGDTVPLEIVLQIAGYRDAVIVTAEEGYQVSTVGSATKTLTPLRDVPQSITVVTQELIRDQLMTSIGDVVRYVPGVTAIQGENNRDQLVIRGNSTSADFFVNGVRDDVQYYRDLYNLERIEALKGPNAMIFGRGGGRRRRQSRDQGSGLHPLERNNGPGWGVRQQAIRG